MSVQKLKISPVTVVTDNKTVKANKIVGVSKFLISPVFNFLHSTFDGFWKMFTTTAGWICVCFFCPALQNSGSFTSHTCTGVFSHRFPPEPSCKGGKNANHTWMQEAPLCATTHTPYTKQQYPPEKHSKKQLTSCVKFKCKKIHEL